MARTLAHVEAEYDLVRTAWQRLIATDIESYSIAGRSTVRRDIEKYERRMDELAKEMLTIDRTTIRTRGATPSYER